MASDKVLEVITFLSMDTKACLDAPQTVMAANLRI